MEDTEQRITAAISDELQAVRDYGALADQLPEPYKQQVQEIARDEGGHARELELIEAAMDDEQSIDVGKPHLIVHEGQPVGIVAVTPGAHEQRLRETLADDGYRLHEAAPDDEETYRLGGECKIEKPKQCAVEIVLGRFEELAEDAGVSSEEVDVLADGEFTGRQAREACAAVLERMPDGQAKVEAATWYAVAFEDAGRP